MIDQRRNGLHHLDSPAQWPDGWDDFGGYPWGFIKATRDESGLDAEEQVDNHDTLAMQMGYAQGEDAALDANWTRYLFTRAARRTAFSGNSDAAGRIWLNLSMVAPFWRQAQSVLTHLKKWEITPDYITCHFRADSDSMDPYNAFDISGDLKQMTGVFQRIAKGEEPIDVKKALGIRNPANPYQDSPDISDFGMISPSGTVYSARPDEPTHAQVADRIIKEQRVQTISSGHPASVLVRQGWVRYLYNKSNALFMMEVSDITKQMPTIRRALASPMAGGAVMVEDGKNRNYYGPTASILLTRIKARDQQGVRNPSITNPMKFVVFSQSGLALGTVTAATRDSALDKLRPITHQFGTRTTQSLYLYPYPSANLQTRYVADQGVQA